MFEILKEKITSWTPEQADAFYSNVDRVGPYGDMIYEKTNNGWFLYSAEKAAYYDLNGESHILVHHSDDLEMSLHTQKMYSDYADQNNLIKIEKPVIIALDEIYGLPYIYCKLVRPYNTHGIPQTNMLYVSDEEKSATAFDVAKIYFKKIDEILQVVDAYQGNLYPTNLETENLFYDSVTENYFWAGDMMFNKTREDSINYYIELTNLMNEFLSSVTGKTINVKTATINYINAECSILQLP